MLINSTTVFSATGEELGVSRTGSCLAASRPFHPHLPKEVGKTNLDKFSSALWCIFYLIHAFRAGKKPQKNPPSLSVMS